MSYSVSRRRLIRNIALATCGGAVHQLLGNSRSFMAFGQGQPTTGPLFILINLAGGASYTMCPLYSAAYRDRNRGISYGPEESLPLSSEQGLHPGFVSVQRLFQDGDGALLNLVGYPDPDFSHAGSQAIWFRGGRSAPGGSAGWAARMTCQMASDAAGVSLAGSNLLTNGDCHPPVSLPSLDLLGAGDVISLYGMSPVDQFRARMVSEGVPPSSAAGVLLHDRARSADATLAEIQSQVQNDVQTTFPTTGFGRICRDAARLAASGLGVQFLYLELGGFDTHSEERQRMSQLVGELDGGVGALVTELKRIGRWRDTTLVTMSEFSRTFANASGGTDHGHAAPMLILGGSVRGGILTPVPSDAAIRRYDYFRDYQVDFRQPFYEIAQRMGLRANEVFPERTAFSSLNIFRT